MRTHDEKWLQENAVFGCRNPNCAEEYSFRPDLLRVDLEGQPVCEHCWDADSGEDDPLWMELRRFWPFGEQSS